MEPGEQQMMQGQPQCGKLRPLKVPAAVAEQNWWRKIMAQLRLERASLTTPGRENDGALTLDCIVVGRLPICNAIGFGPTGYMVKKNQLQMLPWACRLPFSHRSKSFERTGTSYIHAFDFANRS